MENLLEKLEDSFGQMRSALVESKGKLAFYEGFDQTIRAAVADALEAANGIRARASRDAETAQEVLEREISQALSEISAVRERCQQTYRELCQARDAQRRDLQRERERFQQELVEKRAEAEREIALLQERTADERNRLLDEIATLKRQRDSIYQELEMRPAGHLRASESSLPLEEEAPARQHVAEQNAAASLEERPEAATPSTSDQFSGQADQPVEPNATGQLPEATADRPELDAEDDSRNIWGRVPSNGMAPSSLAAKSPQRRPKRGILDILFGRH